MLEVLDLRGAAPGLRGLLPRPNLTAEAPVAEVRAIVAAVRAGGAAAVRHYTKRFDGADIDELHRARCGKCHVRVEPGGRTRDALNVALSRHRNRVHLTEAEWGALIDYLAPREPPTTTPRG